VETNSQKILTLAKPARMGLPFVFGGLLFVGRGFSRDNQQPEAEGL
jgi:hypothetical protein